MKSGLICVGCILVLASLAGGQTPSPVPQAAQFLEFGKVTHQSTWNGQPATMPIYAGRNKAKILYAILLKGQFTADLCVEVTTGFIGRFAPADFQIKGDLMLVNAAAVPKKADDLTLAVANTAEGYQLTIAKGVDTLICKVPAPDDELDKLLKNPPANAPITPLLTAGMQHFTGLEEKAAAVAQAQSGASGPSNANIPSAMPVASANKTFHGQVVPVLVKIQDQRGAGIAPITQQPPQGSGKKTFITPFPAAGTRHEKDTNWMASGLADKISGQLISTTQGIGYSDAKKRGENFSWVECRWNANKAGKLKATGTFVEIHATGLSSPPAFVMATSTAYLYVGVRNERTQKSIWQEYSLGRSPGAMIPFVNILPLRQVTASGLDVQNGDEIVFMVGVCDYSSAKAGAHAHGEANARVQVIEVEVN